MTCGMRFIAIMRTFLDTTTSMRSLKFKLRYLAKFSKIPLNIIREMLISSKLNFIKNFAAASDGGLRFLCADRERKKEIMQEKKL